MDQTNTPIQRAVTAVGSQAEFARQLGLAQTVVWQWLNGLRPVPAHHCIRIEDVTNGSVTRYELRPDVFGPTSDKADLVRGRSSGVQAEAADAVQPVMTWPAGQGA